MAVFRPLELDEDQVAADKQAPDIQPLPIRDGRSGRDIAVK